MITNENFTADTLRELRDENMRLSTIYNANKLLNDDTKNLINKICSMLFKKANKGQCFENYIEYDYSKSSSALQVEAVVIWFRIQGFEVIHDKKAKNIVIAF